MWPSRFARNGSRRSGKRCRRRSSGRRKGIERMYALDFFCGAGGLTRGFLNAGIKVVAGIDIDEDCRQTYETNNAPAKFVASDLRDLTRGEVAKLIRGI